MLIKILHVFPFPRNIKHLNILDNLELYGLSGSYLCMIISVDSCRNVGGVGYLTGTKTLILEHNLN